MCTLQASRDYAPRIAKWKRVSRNGQDTRGFTNQFGTRLLRSDHVRLNRNGRAIKLSGSVITHLRLPSIILGMISEASDSTEECLRSS